MKNKDLKKGKESTIGKIIYGFLLFMPLLAIATTCLYTIFNKNAYQSYADYSYTIQSKTDVTDLTTLPNNANIYLTLNENNTIYPQASYFFEFDYFETLTIPNGTTQFTIGGTVGIRDGYFLTWYDEDRIYLGKTSINDILGTYQIHVLNAYTPNTYYYQNNLYGNTIQLLTLNTTTGKLSDSFYYAVDKVEQSDLFNWAENSLIYTGIANTCTQLSITNTFIPLLLAYWLIISVIYILYDIILMILIILHNRIHRLQDSLS